MKLVHRIASFCILLVHVTSSIHENEFQERNVNTPLDSGSPNTVNKVSNKDIGTEDKGRSLLSQSSSLFKTAMSTVLKYLFNSPVSGKNIKTVSCLAAFRLSGLDFSQTSRFEEWFDSESKLVLAQTGEYTGTASILEYVDFIYGEYFSHYIGLSDSELMLEINDDSEECAFTIVTKRQIDLDTDFYDAGCLEMAAGGAFNFDITGDETFITVKTVSAFYPVAFIANILGLIRSDDISSHVCTIMENNCEDVWNANGLANQDECKVQFESLNLTDGDINRIDGNTQGCKMLHATFARSNPTHCPHISFEPITDINNKTKCQISEGLMLEDTLTSEQLNFFEETSVSTFGLDESMYSYKSGSC